MILNYTTVVGKVAENPNVVKATQFISPTLIVRATRKLFNKRINRGNVELIVTIGKPNYLERKFIKLCKKAKEPFPVKKIQLKMYKKPKK